jgi:predicted nucleic acid-binding protein
MPILETLPETPLVLDTAIFTHLKTECSINEAERAYKKVYVKEKIAEYYSNTKTFPAITSMTFFEAGFGIYDQFAKDVITQEKANEFQQNINLALAEISVILPFDQKASKIASYIYAHILAKEQKWLQQRKTKKKKGNRESKIWQDIFIISTAISHNYGLVSPDKDMEIIGKYLPEKVNLRLAIWKP